MQSRCRAEIGSSTKDFQKIPESQLNEAVFNDISVGMVQFLIISFNFTGFFRDPQDEGGARNGAFRPLNEVSIFHVLDGSNKA